MTKRQLAHTITINFRQENRKISMDVPEGENILRFFEQNGEHLPFSCRNGCCTTCAVKIISGTIDQSNGIGLSKQMQENGYGLLCIAISNGPAVLETQDDDEVYEMQFGKFLNRVKAKKGNAFEV